MVQQTVAASLPTIVQSDKLAVVYQGGPHNKDEILKFSQNFAQSAVMFKERWGGIYRSHFKYPVLFTGKVSGPSGFSMVAKNYIRGLHENGVQVHFEPLDTVLESVDPTNDEVVNALFADRGDMYMPQITWGQAPYFIKNSGIYSIF